MGVATFGILPTVTNVMGLLSFVEGIIVSFSMLYSGFQIVGVGG